MAYTGKISDAVKREFREAAQDPYYSTAVGHCLRVLELWCDIGVPEGIEGRVVRVGVVLYTHHLKRVDLVCYVAVKGMFLSPVALGRISRDGQTSEVLSLAVARCAHL